MPNKKLFVICALGLWIAMLQGCSTPRVPGCGGPGDSPQDHFISGMEALEGDQVETAKGKFERAVYCDGDYSPAYGGLAIVHAYIASRYGDPSHALVERGKSADLLKLESRKARSYEDEMLHYHAVMRTATIGGGKGWFDDAENAYYAAKGAAISNRALPFYGSTESLDYFIGAACRKARKIQQARELFATVIRAGKDGKWFERADRAWKDTDMLDRASTGDALGSAGQKIAQLDRLTRKHVAVLLVNEFGIAKLFAGRIPSINVDKGRPGIEPADITLDPFRSEIITVLKYRVRGLECKYDETSGAYLFRPGEIVTRADMALILEDIIIKLTGDERLATAYLGHNASPFPDVRPTSPVYNAVMVVTTRGIMEPELSGLFRADRPINGAEAILAVRTLQQRLYPR